MWCRGRRKSRPLWPFQLMGGREGIHRGFVFDGAARSFSGWSERAEEVKPPDVQQLAHSQRPLRIYLTRSQSPEASSRRRAAWHLQHGLHILLGPCNHVVLEKGFKACRGAATAPVMRFNLFGRELDYRLFLDWASRHCLPAKRACPRIPSLSQRKSSLPQFVSPTTV